jgi:hypothetical protein
VQKNRTQRHADSEHQGGSPATNFFRSFNYLEATAPVASFSSSVHKAGEICCTLAAVYVANESMWLQVRRR